MTLSLFAFALTAPAWWFFLVAFGFGVIIGSFLNVYIYRFHTGKSLAGSSHCLSCGTSLRWFELFPLVSFLALRARCRSCGCRIPARYFLVELGTALLFAAALTLTNDILLLLLFWLAFAILVVVFVYDLDHFIIPDGLTLALTITTLAILGYDLARSGWLAEPFLWDTFAAVGGGMFFLLLWVLSKGQWLGFGDVKLALPLGWLVGWEYVFSFIVLSFWIGAAVSLLLIGVQQWRKRGKDRLPNHQAGLTMKSAVPFAPFLVSSALVVLFTRFNVLDLFSFI
jgi:leader peptidase (prepilin peptidase)/N-methyltransferase